MGWIQECDVDDEQLPLPTQVISNEEFEPPDQTEEESCGEHRIGELPAEPGNGLGVSRSECLASTGVMAAPFPR